MNRIQKIFSVSESLLENMIERRRPALKRNTGGANARRLQGRNRSPNTGTGKRKR